MGATFFSGPSSAPCTAAIVSFDGLLLPLVEVFVVPQAARIAGIELNAAPVTAVRLTNSRRLIRCIPLPPLRLLNLLAALKTLL
jgi:hypothetical protein